MRINTFKSSLIFLLVANVFLLNSCKDEETKRAEAFLEKGIQLYQSQKFDSAKMYFDAIPQKFPEQWKIINESYKKSNEVSLIIYRQELKEKQSRFDSLQPDIEKLSKDFILNKTAFNQPGIYEHKRQRVKNSYSRIYLKTYLKENGELYISSNYYGKYWLDHKYIRVYDKDISCTSEIIPLDDPDNQKLKEGEYKWETLFYRNGRDKGCIQFIAENWERRLKVRFAGKKNYYIVMETFDKEAVRDAYALSSLLKEQYTLKRRIDFLNKEIGKLQKED